MKVIQWFVIIILFVFWLAEDEVPHIEESVQEGEFEMEEQAIYEEKMASGASIAIHRNGMVTIADGGQEVNLVADEAYSVLDALYRYSHILRGRQDTVPLPEQAEDAALLQEMEEMVAATISEGQEVLDQEQAEQWQASGTCQIDEKHTGRDVFRCDGCECMACNECGELMEDVWLCEACLMPREPIMAHPF